MTELSGIYSSLSMVTTPRVYTTGNVTSAACRTELMTCNSFVFIRLRVDVRGRTGLLTFLQDTWKQIREHGISCSFPHSVARWWDYIHVNSLNPSLLRNTSFIR